MVLVCRAAGGQGDVAFSETGRLPWLADKRLSDDGKENIAVTTRAPRSPSGAYPKCHSDWALRVISAAFPNTIEPFEDVLSAALMNAGPIIHSPLLIVNAGPIRHFDKWDIQNEGTQLEILAVHDALDAERMKLRKTHGYSAPHFPLCEHYKSSNWIYRNLAHDKLINFSDWYEKLNLNTHRYISEDIGAGLCFFTTFGQDLGLDMPVAVGSLALGSVAAGIDFRSNRRTWQSCGLAGLDPEALRDFLIQGERA